MIALTPDKAKWDAQINGQFDRLNRRLAGGIANQVVKPLQSGVGPLVKSKLVRPEMQRGHAGLTQAIEASIRPTNGGGLGVIVGERKVLDSLAKYWRAIELGSSHIIGKYVHGFVGTGGDFAPDATRKRLPHGGEESSALSRTVAEGAGIKKRAIVQRPIPPHHYLDVIGRSAALAVSYEVQARLREAFEGIPYKRQMRP